MAVGLKGVPELKARMNSVQQVFKPAGGAWAKETVRLARIGFARHSKTGRTLASIRIRSRRKDRASVSAAWPARVIEGDTKQHLITAKPGKALRFQAGGRTIFAKKALRRARTGTPFLRPAGEAALRADPISPELIKAWNDAA